MNLEISIIIEMSLLFIFKRPKDSKIEYLDSPDNLELYSISKILDYTQEAIELIRDKMYEDNNY